MPTLPKSGPAEAEHGREDRTLRWSAAVFLYSHCSVFRKRSMFGEPLLAEGEAL